MFAPHVSGSDPDPIKVGLPDSRVRPCERSTICGPAGIMARVYCANCGADGGLVTEDWAESIFFLCDNCFMKHGHLPMLQVPDAVVRGEQDFFDSIPQF